MENKTKSTAEYEKMNLNDAFKFLDTSGNGLNDKDVNDRINTYGYNEISEKKESHFVNFIKRYWGPMPWLLEFAIILTLILGHYSESLIIFILLTMNAIIGYIQSQNSQKAVQLLKSRVNIKVKTIRNGKTVLKESREIVPGDIIILKLGDIVPADVYIIEGNVSADESALTGESLVKTLNQSDVIYSSSIIKSGDAKCLVINTGANTYFGKTVELVEIASPKSKQEELMFSIIKYMMYASIVASFIVGVYAIYLNKGIMMILSFILTTLIGAIPVALPAVLTIVQAVGAVQLSKKGVLVTRLNSIEDAASINIFCFDKTGTITQNKLSIVDIFPYEEGYEKNEIIKLAASACNSEEMDSIDVVIKEYYNKSLNQTDLYKQILYTPFNPQNKRTEAILDINNHHCKIVKGASQAILALCKNINEETYNNINAKIKETSEQCYRSIAVAISDDENGNQFKFLGLITMTDPPREDSKKLIAKVEDLGIKAVMITGDNILIAKKIAQQVGIGSNIILPSDLYKLSDDEQHKLIEQCDGFAEVYPEDKYKIVKLFQSNGHIVGMTGDGVNDAPALKQAELGVAVSESTDVAKTSASIVLTEPGLGGIINAVDISRQTYQKMLTWMLNKITKVMEFLILLTIGFFWLHDIVISLLGISLIVFVNDFLTMSIATDNVKATKYPNKWNIKNVVSASVILGALFATGDLIMIYIGMKYFNLDFQKINTLALLMLVFNSQFRILILRERKHFYSSFPSKTLCTISIITIVVFSILGVLGIFIPNLAINQVITILCFSMIFTVFIDYIKFHIFIKLKI